MTAPPTDLVQAHRDEIDELYLLASLDLEAIWRELTPASPRAVRDALSATLPELADLYGSAAGALGADWYDEMREVAGAPGTFRAATAALPEAGQLNALAGWATQPLFTEVPDYSAALARVDGGLQRLIANVDRDTVRDSLRRDPKGEGWSRRNSGKSCDFCTMLVARGAVYSKHTADFPAHDRCKCFAVPVWGPERKVRDYAPSERFRSQQQRDANNARIREYLRDNPQT